MGSKLQNTQLGTSQLGYALGAEIEGLDISLNLGSKIYEAINHIWQEPHVVGLVCGFLCCGLLCGWVGVGGCFGGGGFLCVGGFPNL